MGRKLLLIDGNSLVHRAFHAIPPLTTAAGENTNAVYGFTTMFLRLLADENPDYIAVAFDKGKYTFRHQEFAAYKANRAETPVDLRTQLPLVKKVLSAYNVPIFELDTYEADDLLGTLARKGEREDFSVIIVTGDQDALQLVSPKIKVLLTRRGISDLAVMDTAAVKDRFAVTPEQIIDYKGLVGDQSDNIPGVPGIGPKTASRLLGQYAKLEEILANLDRIKEKNIRNKLEEFKEQALLSKDLATIRCDAPLEVNWEVCRLQEPDWAALVSLFQELEFRSLLQRIKPEQEESKAEINPVTYQFVKNNGDLQHLLDIVKREGKFAFGIISSEDNPLHGEIIGCAITTSNAGTFYLPKGLWEEVARKQEVRDSLAGFFTDAKLKKVTHGAKAVYQLLQRYGIRLQGLTFDTQIASYLINPAVSHSLHQLGANYLQTRLPAWEELVGKGKKRLAPASLPQEQIATFVTARTSAILQLHEQLKGELERLELTDLLTKVEMPLIAVLAAMEAEGIAIDQEALAEMGTEIEHKLQAVEAEIYDTAGVEFNLNSPKQLAEVLFERLKLPVIKRTKTGYSTDAEVLEQLAPEHPIVELLLEYRQLMKLKSTYIDGLMALIDPVTGKIHTTFNQTVTTTGRLSSTEPNLQNIPVRLELGRKLRKIFVPTQKEAVILAADYSQIELRVLAHISQDPYLIESFRLGQDVHTRTAAEVFGVPLEQVTEKMRTRAKAVNFGIVYGISEFGLARDLGVSRQEAREYISNYFSRYAGVKNYIDQVIAQARKQGYVTTLLKRRRYLPDIKNRNYTLRSFAERTAMNTPIQGTAADIIKVAMVNLYQKLCQRNLATRLLLQVHDELIFSVPLSELAEVKKLVKNCMEDAIQLAVPLKVDLKIGRNWYEVKKAE